MTITNVVNIIFERLFCVLAYTIPLNTAAPFGYYLFYKFSFLKIILYLTLPVNIIEKSLPFGGMIIFFIIFFGIIWNTKIRYFIRFNFYNALILNIGLIIVIYFLRIFPVVELSSIIFMGTLSFFIYATTQCLRGIEPMIPFLYSSVTSQLSSQETNMLNKN